MALSVTHTFVSAIPDDADATLVRPSNWNDIHALSGVLPVANGGTGITSFGTGIDIFLGTPTSANLATAVTDETGTGALVFANTPTFVTPILGTPTSGNLANCTGYPVGSISGTVPATAGGTGQTTYAKGDILASPGSNTLNKLAVSVTDGFVLTVDAASTNGIKWSAASTGSPAGSGTEIQYRNSTAFGAMAGTAWDNTNRSLTMTGATVTTSNPVLNMTQTWNAGAVAFSGLLLNVTNTASAAASKLLDVQVGGVSRFSVAAVAGAANTPTIFIGAATNTGFYAPSTSQVAFVAGGTDSFRFLQAQMDFVANGLLTWGNTNNQFVTTDTYIKRGGAAATLQFGAADAASAVAQTTTVQSIVAGTSNTAGADWTLQASRGTGTGAGGSIIFSTAAAGSTGTAQNAATAALTITPTGKLFSTRSSNSGLFIGNSTSTTAGTEFQDGSFFGVLGGNLVSAMNRGGVHSFSVSTVGKFTWGPGATNANPGGPASTFLISPAAAAVQQGDVDAAAAIAQTTQVQSVVAGTSNTAGADWTFQGSRGTGTGAGGNILFNLAPDGTTGTAQNAAVQALKITPTALASTVLRPAIQIGSGSAIGAGIYAGHLGLSGYGALWSTGVTPSTGNYSYATNGSSTNLNGSSAVSILVNGAVCFAAFNPGGIALGSASNAILVSGGAGIVQQGAADAATATAQTTTVQSVVAGTSGVAGADWTFRGSRSTGTAASGDIVFTLGPNPGIAAATTQNTAVEVLRIQAAGRLKLSHASSFTANGSVATVLGSLGPTGSHTAVQKWLTIVDNGAVVGYIPVF